MENSRSKLLFILPALPDYVPYVYNYFRIASESGIEYDVFCWNRQGERDLEFASNYYIYNHQTCNDYSPMKKLVEIFGFYIFVRHSISRAKYKSVFVFTIAGAFPFIHLLLFHYTGKYVFDIRDYSPLLANPITAFFVKWLLKRSAFNVVSSPGYKRWLPSGFNYITCHNVDIDKISHAFNIVEKSNNDGILRVLTIGSLRDFDSNTRIADAFSNDKTVEMRFVGIGVETFEKFCKENSIKNVVFSGRYHKEEEDAIVKQADMINLFLPHTINSDSCMANRMYLAARLRKPVIVTKSSYQAEVVDKFNLGISVDWDDDLYVRIIHYWQTIDWNLFDRGCRLFLTQVYEEMSYWQEEVKRFMSS